MPYYGRYFLQRYSFFTQPHLCKQSFFFFENKCLNVLTRDIVKELTGNFLSYVLSIKDARSAAKTKKEKGPC
jgi:hypothetical protein